MPRKVKVATTCMAGYRGGSIKANRDYCQSLLDAACAEKPDVVCLPENFATVGIGKTLDKIAESVPGPTVEACAKNARKYRTYVICPLTTKRQGRYYNSAVVIDRKGQVAGIYDKIHPVTSSADFTETEHGMMPGTKPPVFELDFGRVACQICFDLGFPDTWDEIENKGAEIVFWPSAFDGGFPLKLYAYLHKYYVVSAVRTNNSRIIDPLAEVLAVTSHRQKIVMRTIDLDYMICHLDFHWNMPEDLKKTYGDRVTVRVASEEGCFLVESNRKDLPLAKIVKKFSLEAAKVYYSRHYPMYEALRAGRTPKPQETPYKKRQQYS